MARRLIRTKGYKLPPGPRGDSAGGISTPGHPRGNRTGDIRMAGAWNDNVRRYPSAPFGRYEDGSPLPQNFDRPYGRVAPPAKVKKPGAVNGRIAPGRAPNPATGDGRGTAFRKQKGWNS